jgi:hypothetical protein
MNIFDIAGYLAAIFVFAAFCMKQMMILRIVALCSNAAFLIYAFGLHLAPIAALHLALIPVNVWRLWQAVRRPVRKEARA